MRRLASLGLFCLSALLPTGCGGDAPKEPAANVAARPEASPAAPVVVTKGKPKAEKAKAATRPSFQINPNL